MSNPCSENKYYKGDTLELVYTLYRDKANNELWDLTGHQIRFELYRDSTSIKKATANVSGGSIAQINILDAVNGLFMVTINALESVTLTANTEYLIEIQVTDIVSVPNIVTTVYNGKLFISPERITWSGI